MGQGAQGFHGLVEAVVAGDRDLLQALVARDDQARIVTTQFGDYLIQRAVLEDQTALDPGQVLLRVDPFALAKAIGADTNAIATGQANALVTVALQVDIPALHTHLRFAVEIAHGEIAVADAGAQWAGL
ncbi:hypothetical protein D3C72_1917560 [compost metagenome]